MRKAIITRLVPGPHHVYIFYDETKHKFKIGITSSELERYRKQLCAKQYGARSHNKIKTVYSWNVGSVFSASFLEQTIIETLIRLGFERHEGDWFEADRTTVVGVWNAIDDLAEQIQLWEGANYKWENRNYALCCDARHREFRFGLKENTHYGKKLKTLPKGYFGHGLLVTNLAPK